MQPDRRGIQGMFRKKIAIAFLGVLVFLAVFGAKFVSTRYAVPILMYHSINPNALPEDRIVVPPIIFERQMQFLKKHKYNVISLKSLGQLISQKQRIPLKTVVITLDDGFRDNYLYAFPILKKYNLPATIFIIIDEVGRPSGDRLTWDDILLMQESGLVSFGSHCMGPEPLVNIKSDKELKRQIFDSKKILEEKTVRQAELFCYPEGRFNDKIRQMVREAGYKLAVATNPGKAIPNDDLFALKRLRISQNTRHLGIFWIETSGYYNFIRELKRKKK